VWFPAVVKLIGAVKFTLAFHEAEVGATRVAQLQEDAYPADLNFPFPGSKRDGCAECALSHLPWCRAKE
jgi:hypothetical protein